MKRIGNRAISTVRQLGAGLIAILLFIIALELMKLGASGLTPLLHNQLRVEHVADCLGLGWLIACLMMSGSPAAAIAMVLLSANALTPVQTFAMVTGSRLGASFIVLLLGFLYALRGHERWTVLSTGVLSLLLTASVQLSALPIGVLIVKQRWLEPFQVPGLDRLSTGLTGVFDPLTAITATLFPRWGLFVVGAGISLLSFRLFDQALPQLRFEKAGLHRTSRLVYRPVVMFMLGLLVTLLTLSVSVSIGILVPLSARGYIRRENIVPYILGANISTMIDTLAAAVLLGTPEAVTVVLAHMFGAVIVSLPIVALAYEPYTRLMSAALEWTMVGRRNFGIFLGLFFLIPIALILS